MHRILFQIGNLKVYAWGTFVGLGFIIGLLYTTFIAEKRGIKKDDVVDIALSLLISGIVGARVAFVIANWKLFKDNPLKIFYIQEGGMVLYGTILFGIITGYIVVKVKKLDFWKLADLFAPGIALGIAIGRIGCFLNGCCWGKVSYKFGLRFPSTNNPPVYIDQVLRHLIKPQSTYTLPVIPTQLLHSLSAFIVFILLVRLYKKGISFDGEIFLSFVIYYSIGRFLVEFLRYYPPEKYIGPFTGAQAIAIFIIIWALFEYGKRKKRAH